MSASKIPKWLTTPVSRTPALARRFFDRYEPVHGITYFAPGVRSAFDAMGFVGFWRGYFAGRSAPLGQVPVEIVTAIFYNFATERVAKAVPAIWEITTPAEMVRVRQDTAVETLNGYGLSDDTAGVAEAAELAGRAARGASLDGRPLFAANLALPWPDSPLAALWHAATLLREHRGDGHVAVLVSEGISGRQSNVFHAAAGAVPADFIKRTRDYSDEEWASCVQSLAERGLLTATGSLTAAGRTLKDHVELRTDALALRALDALGDAEVERLFQSLTPITRHVIAGGDLPAATPMALRRDDLDDNSARL
jgi:hypothetical protein